jgi:Tol biopolymer transport system component
MSIRRWALSAAIWLAGCGVRTPATVRDGAPDAGAVAGATAEPFAPGIISDANRQWRITFTPDGRTAYFAESEGFFPATRQATIYVTRVGNGRWATPEAAPFSGVYSDIDPFITPDGARLYFSSIRPVGGVARGDIDIWYVERTPSGWGAPIRVDDAVNSPMDELYPSASARGDLYFGVGPPAPNAAVDWGIYSARRDGERFAPRQPVAAVNTDLPFDAANPTADWEFNPEISSDGRMLVFTSLRPGGHGYGDLYVSHHRGGSWSAPLNLGPLVNTSADEFHPTLTRDGLLYFVRNAFGPTTGDFHVIRINAVPALRGGTPDDK